MKTRNLFWLGLFLSGLLFSQTINRVKDGDTVVLSSGETVRLLGINTPERNQADYLEAKKAMQKLVLGKSVSLETDVEKRDNGGRLLGHLWVEGVYINAKIVELGLANAYIWPKMRKHREDILRAERVAQNNQVGLWKRSCLAGSIEFVLMHDNAQGNDEENLNDEYFIIANICQNSISLRGWVIKDESSSNIFLLPNISIEPGEKITIFTGLGESSKEKIFLNSPKPVWGKKDRVFIRDSKGLLVLYYPYGN